jgi:hypothetical protein
MRSQQGQNWRSCFGKEIRKGIVKIKIRSIQCDPVQTQFTGPVGPAGPPDAPATKAPYSTPAYTTASPSALYYREAPKDTWFSW